MHPRVHQRRQSPTLLDNNPCFLFPRPFCSEQTLISQNSLADLSEHTRTSPSPRLAVFSEPRTREVTHLRCFLFTRDAGRRSKI